MSVSGSSSWVHRWVGLPLLVFSLVVAALWGWKQHLSRQLRAASADQNLQECLQLERRLQALDWVPTPEEPQGGRCRREAAERLWLGNKKEQALQLQQELVSSKGARPEDMQRLRKWRSEVQQSALSVFMAGNLEKAVALLRLSDTAGRDPGVQAMVSQLQQTWSTNQADLARARSLAAKAQWWEALSALNGLNHPYWRTQSLPLRKTVEAGLAKVEKKRVDTHGPLPYAIPSKQLDALVKKRMAAGVPDWQAFGEACRALGGRVADGGPEATCEP